MDASKFRLAESTYRSAIKQLAADDKLSEEELRLLRCTTNVEDVRRAVAESMARYEQPGKHAKIKKGLQRAARMSVYYTNFLDCLRKTIQNT